VLVLSAGTVFAGYTIERVLGRGGMGVVYQARQPRLQRSIALKVLDVDPAIDPKAGEAFNREAALVASLEHPNIVAVHDRSGPNDPTLWLAIRYVAGGDADALLSAAPGGVDPARAVRLVTDCAHALDFAHSHNVLHRDVKPANLLIEHDPRHGERALLTDFGIARALDGRSTDTRVSATFAYVAPERFTSQPTDHRADQYSLGCTFYHLLTGQYPFPYPDEAALIAAHLNAPPPAPSTKRPDVPLALDGVVAKALAKDPDHRYATCLDFATAAARALEGPATQTPPAALSASPASPPPGNLNRRRLLIGGVIAIPVVGAVAAAVVTPLSSAFTDTDSATPASSGAPPEYPAPVEDGFLTGHRDRVGAVACSPSGTLIASGSGDGDPTVRLWDAASREALETFPDHEAEIGSVAFSPDGALLASGGKDGKVQLRGVGPGYPERGAIDHGDEVWSVAFSPNSELLVTAGNNQTIRFWDTRTGKKARAPFESHRGALWSVAFNRKGTLLASGSADGAVSLWDLDKPERSPKVLRGHGDEIWSVAFSPDGRFLVAGGAAKVVRVWNIRTGEEVRSFSTNYAYAGLSVAFSPDGTILAAGSANKTVRLWNVVTRKLDRQDLSGHNDLVRSVAFGADGDFLVSGSGDERVGVWAL